MTVAMYPGSFDPVHNGHVAIIKVAASLFDELVVAVGHNPAKESGLFTGPERQEMIELALKAVELDGVRVALFTGLVTDAARAQGADCLVKGVRNGSDLDTELLQANMNLQAADGTLHSVLLPGIGPDALISSRYVREIASRGGNVQSVVPEVVLDRLSRKFREQP